jgi:hypothetical protein
VPTPSAAGAGELDPFREHAKSFLSWDMGKCIFCTWRVFMQCIPPGYCKNNNRAFTAKRRK